MIEARWFIKETVRGKDGQIVKGDDGKPKKEPPFLDAKGIIPDIQSNPKTIFSESYGDGSL